MMKLTLSCVVFVAVLFLHASAYEEPPNDAVDFKAGDLVNDDDATINDDGPKETGEF